MKITRWRVYSMCRRHGRETREVWALDGQDPLALAACGQACRHCRVLSMSKVP